LGCRLGLDDGVLALWDDIKPALAKIGRKSGGFI
jgi:hypothetical protein